MSYVFFCFLWRTLSLSGFVAIVCATLTSGTWCWTRVTPGPTRNRSSSSFSFLLHLQLTLNSFSLCVALFSLAKRRRRRKLWTCRIVFDYKRRKRTFLFGGPFSARDRWMEWNGERSCCCCFISSFFFIFYRLVYFFFFLFTPPPPSRATWKVTGLYTHTQTESTVTGLISDRPAETLSEWLNGKRLSPLLLSLLTNQQKRTSFFSYSIFLLLAGWYQSLFFLISSDFIYFYFLIIRNFVRQFLKMAVALRVDCKSWSTFVPVVGQF